MSKYSNYVPQPLAFYRELSGGDRQYQNYLQEHCKGDKSTWILPVVADFDDPQFRFPPFQIKRAAGGGAISEFKLWHIEEVIDAQDLETAGFFTVEDLDDTPDFEAVIYNGNPQDSDLVSIPDGHYYLTVFDGTNTWYSEVFKFFDEDRANVTFPERCGNLGYMQLGWSNSGCIISETIHNNAPSFFLFVPATLSLPEYEYKPEQLDDGQGGNATTFHRLEKRWQFFITAPEYIADALTSVQLMSQVSITFISGDSIQCRDIEVKVDWTLPCFARITFSFTADLLQKTACC